MRVHLISSLAWRWKLTMGGCCLDCIWGGESHGVGAAHMHVLCRIGDVCHVAAASAPRGSVTEELASSVQRTGGLLQQHGDMRLVALFI